MNKFFILPIKTILVIILISVFSYKAHAEEMDVILKQIQEDLKTLDSHIINIYLVAAVQELKAELDAAKARITELES